MDASTVCRWLIPVLSWGWRWLQQPRVSFSGQVAVDEKAIKMKGVTWYLFVAVDCVTRFPLHIEIDPSNNQWNVLRAVSVGVTAKGGSTVCDCDRWLGCVS